MVELRVRERQTVLLDFVAAVLIPGFVFWFLFWLGKRMGYDVRGLPKMIAASSWLDVGWYTGIAERGYWIDPATTFCSTAFFPLWPALIAVFRAITRLSTATAAAFWLQRVVNVACCFSLIRFARQHFDMSNANHGADSRELVSPYEFALFMFLQPAAIFLMVPYAEALFLFLLCNVLIVYQRIRRPFREEIGRFATLFGLSFLLGVSRPNGLFLGLTAGLYCVTLVFQGKRRSPEFSKTLLVALSGVAAIAAVSTIMYYFTDQPLSFFFGRAGWNEDSGFHQVIAQFRPKFGGMRTMETLYVYLCIGGSILLFRARRTFEACFCLACIILPAYQGKAGDMMRYGLAAMPALLTVQTRIARHRFWYVLLWACCSAMATEMAFKWFIHQWPG